MGSNAGRGIFPWIIAIAMVRAVVGCDRSAADDLRPTYSPSPATTQASANQLTIGILPLRNAARIFEQYQPLVDEINRHALTSGRPIWRLDLAADAEAFDSKLRDANFSAAIVNPAVAVRSEQFQYRIFAKQTDDTRLCGILLTRKDSNIRAVSDLRGQKISFPVKTALAATMLNKMYLYDHGLNVDRDATAIFTGSQDSSILNVFEGITAAGGTWPASWSRMQHDRPDVAAALQVSWQTPPLMQLTVIASPHLDDRDLALLKDTLIHLADSDRGKQILKQSDATEYQAADTNMYGPVRQFLRRYESVFGKIPD